MAALAITNSRIVITLLSLVSGFSVVASALEGHPLGTLVLAIYAGILFAANVGVAVSASLVAVSLDKLKESWMRLGWKIAASWLAAIIILQLAFDLRG